MQTENPVYEEIREVLRSVELPKVALVGQRIDSPPALTSIREGAPVRKPYEIPLVHPSSKAVALTNTDTKRFPRTTQLFSSA